MEEGTCFASPPVSSSKNTDIQGPCSPQVQLHPTALHVIEESCQILIETVAVVCKTIRHTSTFIFDDQNRSQVSESLKVSLERNTVFIHLSRNYDEPTACQLGVRVL